VLRQNFVIVALLLAVIGCAKTRPTLVEQNKPVPPPTLIHLPGIAGEMPIDRGLMRGLVEGGVAPSAEVFDWIGDRRGLPALNGYDENQRQAGLLARRLTALYREDPRRYVTVSAHSGGTAVAVWALEKLPKDVQIDRLVLMASALSPEYDLTPALRHVRGRALSFYSPHDHLVLGTGTRVFGTMDREYTDAAGYVGFNVPPKADPRQYAKFEQFDYDPAWQRLGNFGDHIGVMMPDFAERILAPLLMPLRPTTRPLVELVPQ
jgi:pimeloyl-ACP methyl ester carboxylesterase